jgi:hypothetical protein
MKMAAKMLAISGNVSHRSEESDDMATYSAESGSLAMFTASGSAMLFLGCAVIPAQRELITSHDVINIVTIFPKWKGFFSRGF